MLEYLQGRDISPLPRFFKALREVDDILLKVEQMIVASRSHSPFNNYLTQLSAEQTKTVTDGISELRTAMLCLARREGAMLDAHTVNTAWAIRHSLDVAVAKLANAPPLLDVGPDKHPATNLDEPKKLLNHMTDVFARMDQVLSQPPE